MKARVPTRCAANCSTTENRFSFYEGQPEKKKKNQQKQLQKKIKGRIKTAHLDGSNVNAFS